MAVEMFDLVFAKATAGCHCGKQFFKRFREMLGIVHAPFKDIGNHARRKQAGIFREETKDDAIEKARDTQVLPLSDRMFLARFSVG